MIVVSDTSPIINLAAIGQLQLLPQLYGTVVIPQAVYDEIVIAGMGQPGAKEIAEADWIKIGTVIDHALVLSLEVELDSGEAEAIVLAAEMNADLLLIDERKGRITADRLQVKYIGLLGILISAKHQGLIPSVSRLMDDLMNKANFWIRDDLYNHICRTAGETVNL